MKMPRIFLRRSLTVGLVTAAFAVGSLSGAVFAVGGGSSGDSDHGRAGDAGQGQSHSEGAGSESGDHGQSDDTGLNAANGDDSENNSASEQGEAARSEHAQNSESSNSGQGNPSPNSHNDDDDEDADEDADEGEGLALGHDKDRGNQGHGPQLTGSHGNSSLAQADKVTVCHVPSGNPENERTLSVGSDDARIAHLAHGDSEGECDPS
jgi:hypothetical protein